MNRQFLQSFLSAQAQTPRSAVPSETPPSRSEYAQIVALPRELVMLLEEASQGADILDGSATLCQRLKEAIQARSRYLLHEAESKALDLALQAVEEFSEALRAGRLSQATETALVLYRELHWFEQMREQNRQNPLPGLNELLIWGLSSLHGRADPELLLPLLSTAAADVDAMVELYKIAEEHLPTEIRSVFLLGVERVTQGFSSLQQAQTVEPGSLQSIASGADLLAQLQKWKEDTEAVGSGSVPIAGERVQRMVEQLESSGQIKERTFALWRGKDYPALLRFWLDSRAGLLVSTRHRGRLKHEIEQALEQCQELGELTSEHQRALLVRLDALFAELSAHKLDLASLKLNSRRWKADLILAVVAGGIPPFYLAETERTLREQQQEELALALESFRLEEDPEHLIGLLEAELV